MEPRVLLAGNLKKPENYIRALRQTGLEPVHPGVGEKPDVSGFDALLIPGGGDVHPRFYGEKRGLLCMGVDEALDVWEIALVQAFAEAGKPVLGICRGCQIINVAFGGTLVQHISGPVNHVHTLTGDAVHPTQVVPGGFVAEIYGTSGVVTNSSHHQCVKDVAPGFSIVQYAPDDVPEAMQHATLPVWAVQWHPERMGFALRREDTVNGEEVFRFFKEKILQQPFT